MQTLAQEQNTAADEIPFARMAARMALITLLYFACLFGSAGTFNWPEAWLFWILLALFTVILMTWLKKHNPDLLRERMNFGKKFEKRWDKLIVLSMIPCSAALFIIPGLDTVRFGWSEMMLVPKVFGFFGITAAFAVIFLVMKENRYLSRVVEVQKEKGHTVISTGPYRYVRHPLYAGSILVYLSMPFALGSLYGLIPATLLTGLVVLRTAMEDRTLQGELDGYVEYTMRVKYRLLPGVW